MIMFSSQQRIVCILIVLCVALVAHSQSVPSKEQNSVVSGRVTMKAKPAAGIVVVLRASSRAAGTRLVTYKATSDINGEYRIANVPPGNYIVATIAPALIDTEATPDDPRTLIVNKGETIEHIDFSLVRGGVITGKVVDSDGHPVVEQEVEIYAVPNNNRNYATGQVVTDDRGVYRAFGVRAGSYKVAVGLGEEGAYGGVRNAFFKRTYYPSTPDLDQATVVDVSEGGEATNIDVTLGRTLTTYSASGRIVESETGEPVANAGYGLVHFITPNHRSSMSNGAVSNSRGEFKLDNLVPGKYAVFVRGGPQSNWRAEEVPFEIVDTDVSGIVVQTRKGATVSGVIVLEGTDEKTARAEMPRLMLTIASGQYVFERGASSMVAPDGSFTISGLSAGTAFFQISNSSRFRITRIERGGVVQTSRGMEIREGENISGLRVFMTYGNASIRGAVTAASGTMPAGARFFVWVRSLDENPLSPSSSNTSADADARGQFVIEGLQAGTYEISAGIASGTTHVMHSGKKQQIEVSAGSVSTVNLSVDITPDMLPPSIPRP